MAMSMSRRFDPIGCPQRSGLSIDTRNAFSRRFDVWGAMGVGQGTSIAMNRVICDTGYIDR